MGRRTKQTSLQKDMQTANRHMKRCSIMLIIREIHIKPPMRYHFILVRSAMVKKSINNKCWEGCRKKRPLLDCRWECKLIKKKNMGKTNTVM